MPNQTDLIAIITTNGTIVSCDRGISNLPSPPALGSSIFELVTPTSSGELKAAIATALETNGVASCEVCCSPTANSTRWYHTAVVRSHLATGPDQLLVIGIDVTDQRAAMTRLRQDEADLRCILRSIPDMVFRLSSEGRFVECCPGTDHGYAAPEKFLGKPVDALLPYEVAVTVHGAISEAVETGLTQTVTYALEVHDALRHFEARIGPAETGDLVVIVRDITGQVHSDEIERDLRESRERLVHTSKLESIGQVAGVVAHDFNNLLAVIISFVRFVYDDMQDGDRRRDDLREVLKAADSAKRLTSQLLAFSRRRQVSPVVIGLNAAIASIARILDQAIGSDIDLLVSPAPKEIHVQIDPGQLEQVLVNLAINAKDAMPTGGTLTIGLASSHLAPAGLPHGDYVQVTITDTGVGMSDQVLARVFEPFFTTKGEGGSGLGLATCFGIIRQSGGDITVRSTLGQGTTFELQLPLVDSPRVPVQGKPTPAMAEALEGTALVVDDQHLIVRMLSRILERAGLTVVEASSAEEALALRWGAGPDLLVSDVVLPGMTGVELATQLRRTNPRLPVILCSAYPDQTGELADRADEMTVFLAKPFAPSELVAELRRMLRKER